jgi:hypothetical protein
MPDDKGWNLSLTGRPEKTTVGETIKEVSRMGERAKADSARFADATDSSFYACLVFQSSDQRDAFIEAMKWRDSQDDEDPCYIDGVAVAQSMGIPLPQCPPMRKQRQTERWAKLARET